MSASDSAPSISNCTFVGNSAQADGGYFSATPAVALLTNCILWGNTATTSHPQIYGVMNATYSCIEGGYAGQGNINMDPLFVNAAGGDLRLLAGSPCIDAGNNAAVGGVLTDILGLPRFFDDPNTPDCQWVPGTCGTAPIVDMGAHEFVIMPGDFDDDYDVDGDDLDLFVSCASGPGLAYDDGCESADLDGDQDVDSTDFAILQRCYSGAGRVADPACAQ